MKLNLKQEYLDTTISFLGTEYLLRLAPENMYQHFYKGGFNYMFEDEIEIEKPKKKKED